VQHSPSTVQGWPRSGHAPASAPEPEDDDAHAATSAIIESALEARRTGDVVRPSARERDRGVPSIAMGQRYPPDRRTASAAAPTAVVRIEVDAMPRTSAGPALGRRRAREILVALAALALASGAPGCKRKEGGKCDDARRATCEDATTVLACQGGVLVSARCHGPNGCSRLGNKVTCDDSVAEEGDTCLDTDAENHACSADKKTHLVCDEGKFRTAQVCRGPKACTIKGELPTCDTHLGQKDDVCTKAGSFSCAVDRKTRLLCRDGKMQIDRFCRGQSGCREADFACDETVSAVGDPCGVAGLVACSEDGKPELVCQGGQYTAQRQCKKVGCRVTASRGIDCQ
jgi:hypothetical protein